MELNAFYGKKKIAVVNIGNNNTAKAIAKALKENGFNNVAELDGTRSYPNYFGIAEIQPDYTIAVEEGASCKVKPYRVSGYGNRAGMIENRDLTESQIAKECYRHHLKMIGLNPYLLGAVVIPFEEVKRIEWFYRDKTPLLYLRLPGTNVESESAAVCAAIQDYFAG